MLNCVTFEKITTPFYQHMYRRVILPSEKKEIKHIPTQNVFLLWHGVCCEYHFPRGLQNVRRMRLRFPNGCVVLLC